MSEIAEINKMLGDAFKKSFYGDFTCLEDIRHLKGGETGWIYSVAQYAFISNLKNHWEYYERDVQAWFKENYKDILGEDYEIVKRRSLPQHIPDFWLKYKGKYIPVECKRGAFDKKALNQLNRYIKVYGADWGIAVAKKLKCTLPYNIRFIEVSA